MNSLERILTTLQFKEPDRVPFLLLLSLHGAKELGLTIKEYFSKPEYVAEGQKRLLQKYQHDCCDAFHYASVETEAWGGETLFFDDNAPNAGEPIVNSIEEILNLTPPDISNSPSLQNVIKSIELMTPFTTDQTPIIGVVMSPFSLPVMQLGFERYLNVIYQHPKIFDYLMKINSEFCIKWANAQLAAGATVICYFDPISSPTIIAPKDYAITGQKVAKHVISQFNGPAVTHFASGRVLNVAEELAQTGTVGIGVGCEESLTSIKAALHNKLTIIGNLNGIEMCSWDKIKTEATVKSAIKDAAKGGGFILSDVHGEIPFQVKDEVLETIRDTVFTHGVYKK